MSGFKYDSFKSGMNEIRRFEHNCGSETCTGCPLWAWWIVVDEDCVLLCALTEQDAQSEDLVGGMVDLQFTLYEKVAYMFGIPWKRLEEGTKEEVMTVTLEMVEMMTELRDNPAIRSIIQSLPYELLAAFKGKVDVEFIPMPFNMGMLEQGDNSLSDELSRMLRENL